MESEDELEDEEKREQVGPQLSDYARRRAENIAENKLILEKLFPASDSLLSFHKSESTSDTKLSKKDSEIGPRHGKQTFIDGFFTTPASPLGETSSGAANQPTEKSDSVIPSINDLHNGSNIDQDSLSVSDNNKSTSINNLNVSDPNNQKDDSSVNLLNADSPADKNSTSVNLLDADLRPDKDSINNLNVSDHNTSKDHKDDSGVDLDFTTVKDIDGDSCVDADMADTTTDELPSDVAQASETRVPEKDEFLPTWLAQTIVYLRRVSEDRAWQDLVTEFIQFEKIGPPIGVC